MNTKQLIAAAADLDANTIANLKKLAMRAGEEISDMFPFQRRQSFGSKVVEGTGFMLFGVAVGVTGVAIAYIAKPELLRTIGKAIRTAIDDTEEAVANAAEAVVDKKNKAAAKVEGIVEKITHLSDVKDDSAKGRPNGQKSHSPS